MTSNIERRLQRLEQHQAMASQEMFFIWSTGQSDDELRQHFGILNKPGREIFAINLVSVRRAENGELVRHGSFAPGRGRITEPLLDHFGPAGGPQRDGSEWAREF